MATSPSVPAALQARPFSVAEALSAGLTRAQLRLGAFTPIFRGVYAPADLEITTELRLLAALKTVSGDCAIAGRTALELSGVPRPIGNAPDGDIHIVRARGASYRGQQGMRVHTTLHDIVALEHKQVPGLRYTDRSTSWIQVAMTGASRYDLICLGDAIAHGEDGTIALHRLRGRLQEAGVFRGLKRARSALHWIRPRTMSVMESHLRLLILASGLPEPEVNVKIWDDDGVLLAMLDLAYVRWGIDVEYNGDVHRLDRSQWRRDEDRHRTLQQRGWQIVSCNGSILRDPAPFLSDLRTALLARGWSGEPSSFPYTLSDLGFPVPHDPQKAA